MTKRNDVGLYTGHLSRLVGDAQNEYMIRIHECKTTRSRAPHIDI